MPEQQIEVIPIQYGDPALFIMNDMMWNDGLVRPGGNLKKVIKKSPIISNPDRKIEELYNIHVPDQVLLDFASDYVREHSLPTTYTFKTPKNLIGIEVEVENVLKIGPNIPLCFWKIENDGSLRNNGKEFKTKAIPVSFAEAALTLLFRELNQSVDFSNRTSIHVHLDVRKLTSRQVLSCLMLYLVCENLLFKFADTRRKTNVFCVPLIESNLLETFGNTGASPDNFLNSIKNWKKYSALNLLPILEFGTIEFRHMPGTNNIAKLLLWIDLLNHIKLFAYKNPFESVLQNIIRLNTTSEYRQFLDSVFGNLVKVLDTSALLGDMEQGVTQVKECGLSNKFDQEIRSRNFSLYGKSLFHTFAGLLEKGPDTPNAQIHKEDLDWLKWHWQEHWSTSFDFRTYMNYFMKAEKQLFGEDRGDADIKQYGLGLMNMYTKNPSKPKKFVVRDNA